MKEFKVKDHEPSFLPDGEWELAWADEFDGTELDETKWDYRTAMMGREHPAWTRNGVHLDGKGNVVFTMIEEDGRPVSSQLQTGYNFMDQPLIPTTFGKEHLQWNIGKLHKHKYLHGYGYYEFKPNIVVPHNVFTGGYGLDMQRSKVGGNVELDTEEFHRFGLLWDETGYTFYIDGKEDGKVTEKLTGRPEFILISTEVHGYRYEDHTPTQEACEAIGDTFVVDYVRVFDKVL